MSRRCKYLVSHCAWRLQPGNEDQLKPRCERDRRWPCAKVRASYDPGYRAYRAERDRQYRKIDENNRRARNAGLLGDLKVREWRAILDDYHHCCAYCGQPGTDTEPLTLDHVVPLAKGGGTTAGNVVPACRACNERKADLLPHNADLPSPLLASIRRAWHGVRQSVAAALAVLPVGG
jgi:5-methylcytosine-specific restriction endonuclease McrA